MEQTVQEDRGEKKLLSEQEEESQEQDSQKSCLHTGLGYAAIIAATLSLSVGLMCAQALGGLVPPFEMNCCRYCAQLMVVAPVLLYKRTSVRLQRQEAIWVALVAFSSVTFNIMYYTAGTYLPVGTVGGVGPSLWVIMCALVTVVLDRKCAYSIVIACLVCAAGILLVTQPPFVFRESESVVYHPLCGPLAEVNLGLAENMSVASIHESNSSHNSSIDWREGRGSQEVGYLYLFGTGVAIAIQYVVINKKLFNVNGFLTSFWVSVAGISSQFIIMLIVETPVLPDKPVCVGLMLGQGFGAGLDFVLNTWGLQFVIPPVVSLLNSLGVVFLFIAQYTLLKSVYPGRGNWIEVLGALLVLIGNVVTPAVEICKRFKQGRQNYKQMS